MIGRREGDSRPNLGDGGAESTVCLVTSKLLVLVIPFFSSAYLNLTNDSYVSQMSSSTFIHIIDLLMYTLPENMIFKSLNRGAPSHVTPCHPTDGRIRNNKLPKQKRSRN
jgi:hypothetical protein